MRWEADAPVVQSQIPLLDYLLMRDVKGVLLQLSWGQG